MEKALFPLRYMRQTQGVNGERSHQGTYAIDYGSREEKEKLYAPFTGIIKKIYTHSGNGVWLESVDKVLWADGTIDYMTILTLHDDDVSSLKVGDEIDQGTVYYQQGTAGNATGVHIHLEVGRGKFNGSGWYQNDDGIWMINNAVHPEKAFFLTDDVIIEDDGGYNWRRLLGNTITRDIEKDQIEIKIDNLRCRRSPNGEILGYVNRGMYNIISKQHNGNYDWYQIEPNLWVAYSSDWAKLYLTDVTDTKEQEETIKNLNEQLINLEQENNTLMEKMSILEKDNQSIFEYVCSKTDTYAIKLYKDEILYIKKYK